MATATLSLYKTNGTEGHSEAGYHGGVHSQLYATYKFILAAPTKSITISFKANYMGFKNSFKYCVNTSSANTSDFSAEGSKSFSGTKQNANAFYPTEPPITFTLNKTFSAGTHYFHITNTTNNAGFFYLTKGSVTYTPVTYTVQYNANGGINAPSQQTKQYNETLNLTTNKPTYTGYTFKNWNTDPKGGGDSYSPGGAYTINESIMLYAQWQINTLTIQMNVNGGTKASDASPKMTISNNIALYDGESQTVNYGSNVNLWDYNSASWIKLTKAGYIVSPGKEFYTINSDGTIKAIYNQATTYKISDFADITKGSKTVTLYVNWKTGGIVHYSDGTQWIPCQVYYSDGTQWIHVMPYYSDGSEWIQCT